MLTLILGGARSGKSRYAEQCAKASAAEVYYIATAQAKDEEMLQRIRRHQRDGPVNWHTVEEPTKLARILGAMAKPERCLLVECLTLWLSNVLFDDNGHFQEQDFQQERAEFLSVLTDLPGNIILVSNEVGSGVVAVDRMTRRYVDEAGILHQKLAEISDRVILVTAGLPQVLKA